MAQNTLYEYYKANNQQMPTLAERAKIYESQGLGSAGSYSGTAEQNSALLGKLTSAPTETPAAKTSTPTTTQTPTELS